MQDFVPNGTGNSRYLKSVENFKTLYPTYDDFVAALAAGTLPVDFNGINMSGISQRGTALNKSNLLTDDTAALFGLDASAVPEAVFAFLGKYNQHWWKRTVDTPLYGYQEVKTSKTYLNIVDINYNGEAIEYSDKITISQTDGTITLSSPASMTMSVSSSSSNLSTLRTKMSTLLGKYFIFKNVCYFAPANASYEVSTEEDEDGYETAYSYFSNIYTVTSVLYNCEKGAVDTVYSNDRNAYPDSGSDGTYIYEYLGIPFENAVTAPKIATGSYVGTGTYGAGNPCSLTFDFAPKFIILIEQRSYNPDVLILARGVTKIGILGGSSSSYTNYVTWDDKTVQWYASSDDAKASYQMNALKTTYDYVAIG